MPSVLNDASFYEDIVTEEVAVVKWDAVMEGILQKCADGKNQQGRDGFALHFAPEGAKLRCRCGPARIEQLSTGTLRMWYSVLFPCI